MKKTKIIIPALGVMLLSTAASVTGTVAWFSMNNFVNATQMKVTAKAENGIVISNVTPGTASDWKEQTTSAYTDPLAVFPTSTQNASTWVHSKSTQSDDNNTDQEYEMLSGIATSSTNGAGWVNTNGQEGYQSTSGTTTGENPTAYDADAAYYLCNSFYIKSSANTAITGSTLYITKVSASVVGTSESGDLNKALRVLVKLHGDDASARVYAPFRTAAYEYQVVTALGNPNNYTNATKATVNALVPGANNIVNTQFLTNQTIPASSQTPLQIDIYLYYEGEDEECKSANLTANLDNLSVDVEIGTQQRQ